MDDIERAGDEIDEAIRRARGVSEDAVRVAKLLRDAADILEARRERDEYERRQAR